MRIWDFLTETVVGGNELWRIAALFLTVLGAFIVGKIVRYLFQSTTRRLDERYSVTVKVLSDALGRSISPLVMVLGARVGLVFLNLTPAVASMAHTTVALLLVGAVAWIAYCLVDIVDHWFGSFAESTESKLDDMLFPVIRKSIRITIVILALVQMATILSDKPLTSVLAGLGVGGLALALAAQDTLRNFFGSLMIFVDKPFEMGDRIVVGGHDGPVEEVGLRSTRIRTLDGHLVTIPNGQLAHDVILNVGKRIYLKRAFDLGITYDTPPEKVERALEIVKELLENHEGMSEERPPKVHFNAFNDASLNIQVIYWYNPPDWWGFQGFSERINLEILRRFNQEGIEFAFPSQTLYLAGDSNRPISVGSYEVKG